MREYRHHLTSHREHPLDAFLSIRHPEEYIHGHIVDDSEPAASAYIPNANIQKIAQRLPWLALWPSEGVVRFQNRPSSTSEVV